MVKILALAALMFALTAGLFAQLPANSVNVDKPSFISIILRKPQIFDNLPKDKDITVFAPSDEAFSKLNPEIRDNIFKPEFSDQLKKLMYYHVTDRGLYS